MLHYGVHQLGVTNSSNWDKTLLVITVLNIASFFTNTMDHFESDTFKDPENTLWFCFTAFPLIVLLQLPEALTSICKSTDILDFSFLLSKMSASHNHWSIILYFNSTKCRVVWLHMPLYLNVSVEAASWNIISHKEHSLTLQHILSLQWDNLNQTRRPHISQSS